MTSNRNVQIEFSGLVNSSIIQSALQNDNSPGSPVSYDLFTGNNTITVPNTADLIATAATLIPPPANTVLITLKGANGDVGIPLHPTDPGTIPLDPTAVSFVLNVASDVADFLIIFS